MVVQLYTRCGFDDPFAEGEQKKEERMDARQPKGTTFRRIAKSESHQLRPKGAASELRSGCEQREELPRFSLYVDDTCAYSLMNIKGN